MIKKLYAVDEAGQPIPGALFTFTYVQDGTTFTVGVFDGGQSGSVSLDTAMNQGLFAAPNHVTVTAPGYASAGTDADVVPDSWQFIMPKQQSLLPVLGLGALLAIGGYAIYNSGKGKVGNADEGKSKFDFKNDVLPYVVPAAVLWGGYLVYQQFFGATDEQKKYNADLDAGIAAADAQAPPVLTDAEIAIMANTLSNDISSFSGQTNVADILAQFERVNNTAELLRLIKAYGTRWTFLLGIPRGKYTLQEALKQNVDGDTINLINQYLTNASIHFQF